MRRTASVAVWLGLVGVAASVAAVACGGDSLGPVAGSEGGPCYPNGTCNDGLVCLSSFCVSLESCHPGATTTCSCGGLSSGVAECGADERWEPCVCIPTCGDGYADVSEACDWPDLAGQDCSDFGFTAGELSCVSCEIDVSGCCDADLAADIDHCGMCHSPCGETADRCLGGACSCGLNGACAAGDTCCDGECVQVASDFDHCGGCGDACDAAAGDGCTNSVCTCGGFAACDVTNGFRCCGAACLDVTLDELNCGGCDVACATGETCVSGDCLCGSGPACAVDQGCCFGTCKYLLVDVTNCGGCGVTCATGETCVGGDCMCGGGPACTFGQGCCNGSCVSLDSTEHCGSCTVSCATNEGCYGGVCGCGAAGVVCEGVLPGSPGECCSSGGCVVYMSLQPLGIENCGSCGNTCAFGMNCIGGVCQ